MNDKPLVFAFVDQAVRTAFLADLALYLRKTWGAVVHHYTPSQASSDANRKRYSGIYDSFNVIERGERPLRVPDDVEGLLKKAAHYERRYGIPLGWLRMVDRNMGI